SPSVTTSSRIGRERPSTALVIGATPSTSTSFNCSIQAMMPLSSAAMGATRSSGSESRASLATRRTVFSSIDMALRYQRGAPRSRAGGFAGPGPCAHRAVLGPTQAERAQIAGDFEGRVHLRAVIRAYAGVEGLP